MLTRTTTLGAIAVLSVATLASAQPGPGRPGRGPQMMHGMARALDLTEEQRASMKKAMEQQRPQMQALREQMRENREKLRVLLESGNPEPAEVGQLVIQGHKLREQGRTLREQHKQAFRALLTPEQQQKLELLEKMRPAGRGAGHRRGFGPGGPGAPGGGPLDPADQPEKPQQ